RYAIVINCAIAAVLTPPDVGSMLLLAVPLCILYEISLIGIWFTERRRSRRDQPEPETTTPTAE
ncbi:MAG: twin-arginine translocase subunit TatC, partial [Allosphingosinicella sp.]